MRRKDAIDTESSSEEDDIMDSDDEVSNKCWSTFVIVEIVGISGQIHYNMTIIMLPTQKAVNIGLRNITSSLHWLLV